MKSACRAAAAVPASVAAPNESRPLPDLAQAGGTEPAKLPDALKSVRAWVEQKL
jgi:hypothetical protein